MRILFIGDIVGRPGRQLIKTGLQALVSRHDVDFVIANGENAAAGFGITREIGDELLDLGVDVLTSGNHIWDKKEALDFIGTEPRLLRPANYPAGAPGNGSYVARARNGQSVGVINVMGRVFMLNIDDPFTVVLREIEAMWQRTRIIFVDFAEATSEKVAIVHPGRQGHRGGRHILAQIGRRARAAEGHGLHRRRDDWPARFHHRRRSPTGARAIS
jgi:metallophosphoesterase (TIGR00282 family)